MLDGRFPAIVVALLLGAAKLRVLFVFVLRVPFALGSFLVFVAYKLDDGTLLDTFLNFTV
jgi:hypothetical protein